MTRIVATAASATATTSVQDGPLSSVDMLSIPLIVFLLLVNHLDHFVRNSKILNVDTTNIHLWHTPKFVTIT